MKAPRFLKFVALPEVVRGRQKKGLDLSQFVAAFPCFNGREPILTNALAAYSVHSDATPDDQGSVIDLIECRTIANMISGAGLSTDPVKREKAVEEFGNPRHDMIVVVGDVKLVEEIRQNPELNHVWIVALTRGAGERHRMIEAGADFCIPHDEDVLDEIFHQHDFEILGGYIREAASLHAEISASRLVARPS